MGSGVVPDGGDKSGHRDCCVLSVVLGTSCGGLLLRSLEEVEDGSPPPDQPGFCGVFVQSGILHRLENRKSMPIPWATASVPGKGQQLAAAVPGATVETGAAAGAAACYDSTPAEPVDEVRAAGEGKMDDAATVREPVVGAAEEEPAVHEAAVRAVAAGVAVGEGEGEEADEDGDERGVEADALEARVEEKASKVADRKHRRAEFQEERRQAQH